MAEEKVMYATNFAYHHAAFPPNTGKIEYYDANGTVIGSERYQYGQIIIQHIMPAAKDGFWASRYWVGGKLSSEEFCNPYTRVRCLTFVHNYDEETGDDTLYLTTQAGYELTGRAAEEVYDIEAYFMHAQEHRLG